MIYFCKLKLEVINRGKAIGYCFKRNCWALKNLRHERELKHYLKIRKNYAKFQRKTN